MFYKYILTTLFTFLILFTTVSITKPVQAASDVGCSYTVRTPANTQSGTCTNDGADGKCPVTVPPGPVNVDVTLLYPTDSTVYYKLKLGNNDEGEEIVEHTSLGTQDSQPTNKISFTVLPVYLLEGKTFTHETYYSLIVKRNNGMFFGAEKDSDICIIRFIVDTGEVSLDNNDEDDDDQGFNSLCCDKNWNYDSKEGECDEIDGEEMRQPYACSYNKEDNSFSPGLFLFSQLCKQVGVIKDESEQDGSALYDDCITCQTKGGIYTAVGCIPTDSTTIIKALISLAISLAGGFALLLILYGSFIITSSTGNPQKVQEGKEIVTAAITGLVFIILSVAILQFIGIQIINIPGLT